MTPIRHKADTIAEYIVNIQDSKVFNVQGTIPIRRNSKTKYKLKPEDSAEEILAKVE